MPTMLVKRKGNNMTKQWHNPGQDIAYRLNKAITKNPVAELAKELYSEGYTDGDINKLLLKENIKTEDRINLTNYLRDLKRKQ